MVMWRVWLCVRSSGVIFRSCGVPRWHHPPPPTQRRSLSNPSFSPWGVLPCMAVPYSTASRHSVQTHMITSSIGRSSRYAPLVMWSQVDSCKYRCECIQTHWGCIKIWSLEPHAGVIRQACDPIYSVVWTHMSLTALKVNFVVCM